MIAGVILGLVALALVALVAWPYVRPLSADDHLDALTDSERRRVALLEERDLALGALRELEVDHATHQIDDRDYAELVGEYRARAAAAIAALDALSGREAAPVEPTQPAREPLG